MTSRHSSYWYFLSSEQRIFLYFLGFQVMAILCCTAKNSLRGTATIFSKERNSELVSLPLNGLEQNSKCLLLFCSVEWFGTEFREFSIPRNSRNSAGTNQLFRLFHGIIFLVGNCQPYCWGIREVARGGKYFLSYEGRAMKGEIWVERDKGRVERGGGHRDAEREEVRRMNEMDEWLRIICRCEK
jgi:hypothetical protein